MPSGPDPRGALADTVQQEVEERPDLQRQDIGLRIDEPQGGSGSAPPTISGEPLFPLRSTAFCQITSAISVELLLSDGYVDIVGQGIDIALRFGSVMDSSLRVRSLGLRRRVLCAAPSYLEKHGVPKNPIDLKKHNCLVMRFGMNLDNVWRFGADAMPQIVTVRGDRIANDGALVRQWCLAGHGIMLKSELDVGPDIRAGNLVELLADYAQAATPVQMLFPPSRAQPRRVRALADRLALVLQSLELSRENAG